MTQNQNQNPSPTQNLMNNDSNGSSGKMSKIGESFSNFKNTILSSLAYYVSLGMIGLVLGTIWINRHPDVIASAVNLRGNIGWLGLFLILSPLIDKIVTPKSMMFSLLVGCAVGGILVSWSLGVNISSTF